MQQLPNILPLLPDELLYSWQSRLASANGPGEAREADIGIAGGDGCGVLFVHGELKEKLPYDELLPALLRYIDAM